MRTNHGVLRLPRSLNSPSHWHFHKHLVFLFLPLRFFLAFLSPVTSSLFCAALSLLLRKQQERRASYRTNHTLLNSRTRGSGRCGYMSSSSPSSAVAPPSTLLPSLRRRGLDLFHAKLDTVAFSDPSRTRFCGRRRDKVEFVGVLYPSRARICCRTSVEVDHLGVFDPPRTRISGCRKSKRKKGIFPKAREDDSFATDLRIPDVEAEIYEFMQNSAKPTDFPTRKELIAAGRADLAEAVAAQGGWLTFGWDLDGDEVNDELKSLGDVALEDGKVYEERVRKDSLTSDPLHTMSRNEQEDCEGYPESFSSDSSIIPISECHSSTPSSSGRLLESENEDDSGIEGILRRLERERNLSFFAESGGKPVNGKLSWRNPVDDPGDTIFSAHKLDIHNNERNSGSESTFFLHDDVDILGRNDKMKDVSGTTSSADTWRSWMLQRAGFSMANFEAAEIDITSDKKIQEDNPLNAEYGSNNILQQTQNSESHNEINGLANDKSNIHSHLQHIEADPSSVVHILKSKANGAVSQKYQGSSVEELHKLSDAWEFQETEIMKAKDKLRSIRAKLAILEGKQSFEIIEAQKLTEEKQKKIDAAQSALLLLRSTCIVWPNSASEVLLAGSFDGWTSQRRMERSNSGFSLHLNLYPGRYEIKFIVDGVWKVDPLRPIVNNNGHENNLLIVH